MGRGNCLRLGLLLPSLALPAPQGPADRPILQEDIDVRWVQVDLRVLDAAGRVVAGLRAEDFRVEVEGRPVEVEALAWVAGAYAEQEQREADVALPDGDPGQLVVLLFQRDLDPSRIVGLMRMRPEVMRFVERLDPRDRVAVLVHDQYRLKLYSDFTADRERLSALLDHGIVKATPPPPVAAQPFPSLAAHFDGAAAARATTAGEALGVIAAALKPLPGAKALVFVGHGLGRGTGRSLPLLIDARTTIFGLDVTRADWHTLELGFTRAAVATGGFYAKTHVFTNAAMERVAAALDGHYELWFARPDLPQGAHALKIELRDRRGTVFHNDRYYDPVDAR